MEQLFDDLEDFGAFDDAVSGDVRDPYTELARLRREEPVQRLDMSGACPHEESQAGLHRVPLRGSPADAARQRDVLVVGSHRGVRPGAGRSA